LLVDALGRVSGRTVAGAASCARASDLEGQILLFTRALSFRWVLALILARDMVV
jgi:hypothetical protein